MNKVILISAINKEMLENIELQNIKNVEYIENIQTCENMIEVSNVLNYIKNKSETDKIIVIKEKIDLNPSSTMDEYKKSFSLQFRSNLSYQYDEKTNRWIVTKYDRSIDNNIHNNILTQLNGLG